MNAQVPPPLQPGNDALRMAFRDADRKERPKIMAQVLPQEIEFAGMRMFVHPADNYTEQRIWLDGQPPEMDSLMALVLDIGANCGAFTVPLGLAVGPGSRVIAFEPNPVMIKRLQYNLDLNGLTKGVEVEGCALGGANGDVVLNLKRGNYGQASVMPIRDRQRAGGTRVPLRRLLDFVAAQLVYDISVLKIDVEGGEEAVLAPMLAAGDWLPDVILMETRHAAEWESDLLGQIATLGFRTARAMDGNTLFVRGKAA